MTTTLRQLAATGGHDGRSRQLMDMLRQSIRETMGLNGDDPQHLENVSIRFFSEEPLGDDDNVDGVPDLEMTMTEFAWHVAKGYDIAYERHTVRENGVSQICLTLTV